MHTRLAGVLPMRYIFVAGLSMAVFTVTLFIDKRQDFYGLAPVRITALDALELLT